MTADKGIYRQLPQNQPHGVEVGSDEADDALVRSGRMPTTSVRRRTSRLRRSLGLFDQICRRTLLGNPVNARNPGRAVLR